MFTDQIIRRALEEDLPRGDLTTEAIVPEGLMGNGKIVTRQEIVLAGLGVAGGVFVTLDPKVRLEQPYLDGHKVKKGEVILRVTGSLRSLLKAERVALNFLQRMCGIATLTRKYVGQMEGTSTKILDTRKTAPVYRHLDKYAVRMGGGLNHRASLSDGIMIKDNHIAACRGDLKEAIRRVKEHAPGKPYIIEVDTPTQAKEAVEAGATRLLLDNFTDADVQRMVKTYKGKVQLEVSGGITLERVKMLAQLGVDFISIGALTHSPPAVDLSFEVVPG